MLGSTVPKRVRPPRFHRALLVSGVMVGLVLFGYSSTQVYLHFSDPQEDAGTDGESLEQIPPDGPGGSAGGNNTLDSPETAASEGGDTQADVSYEATPRADQEFSGEVSIRNNGGAPLADWDLELTFDAAEVVVVWGAEWEPTGTGARISPMGEESALPPGESTTIHFDALGTNETPSCHLNGETCGI
ncbi:cellulose binding domain-containing protein [Spiractinospora alimapuensis]|uniref:cellulose binding domain-containing protein n=1 Tax=Spiractinospora alimapuensis TaxID=2820884 RepID=UPI001F170D61|nr:cellulose binding domain-containing protein [Spiractinospora alimapuensis]